LLVPFQWILVSTGVPREVIRAALAMPNFMFGNKGIHKANASNNRDKLLVPQSGQP